MPVNGKIFEATNYVFEIKSSASATASGTAPLYYVHDAKLEQYYLGTSITTREALTMEVTSSTIGSVYSITGLVSYYYTDATYRSNISLTVEFVNVKIYTRLVGNNLRFVCDEVKIYRDGTLVSTLGALTVDSDGNKILPGWLPVLGLPPRLSGGLGGSGGQTTGNYAWDVGITRTISGGYRYSTDGGTSWIEPEVSLPVFPEPGGSGPFGLTNPNTVISTHTWGDHISDYLEASEARTDCPDVGAVQNEGDRTLGVVWLIPNYESDVNMPEDYCAAVRLKALPKVELQVTRAGGEDLTTVDVHSLPPISVTDEVVYELVSEQIGGLNNDKEFFEGNVDREVVCPVIMARSKGISSNPSTDCDDAAIAFVYLTAESVGYTFPSNMTYTANHFVPLRWLGSATYHIPNYTNFIAHPLHSLFFDGYDWEINGAVWPYNDYWERVRQQTIFDDTGRFRNHIRFDPLGESPFIDYLETYVPNKRWIGACRFDVIQEALVDVPFGFTSYPLVYDIEDCAVTFFAGEIEVDPSATVCEFKLQLGANAVYPYSAYQIRDLINLNWFTDNVVDIKVYVGNRYEPLNEYLLEETPGDGTTNRDVNYPYIQSPDKHYACSLGIDNGGLFGSTACTDEQPDGKSVEIFTDEFLTQHSALLSAGTGYYIRFVITVTSTSDTVSLYYPVLKHDTGSSPINVVENSIVTTTLRHIGGVTRIGNLFHVYGGSFNAIPQVQGKDTIQTTVDILGNINTLQGRVYSFDVATRLSSFYDSFETQSIGAHSAGTVGVYLGTLSNAIFYTIDNCTREIPPMRFCPSNRFNFETFSFDNVLGLYVTSVVTCNTSFYCNNPEYQILDHANNVVTLDKVDYANWQTQSGKLYLPAFPDEDRTFKFKFGTKIWHKFYPWDGALFVNTEARTAGDSIAYPITTHNVHYLFYTSGEDLYVNRYDNTVTLKTTTLVRNEVLQVAADNNSKDINVVVAITDLDDNVIFLTSTDNWNSIAETNLGITAVTLAIAITSYNLILLFRIESGNLECRRYDQSFNLLGTTTVDTGVDDGALACNNAPTGDNNYSIYVVYSKAGALTIKKTSSGVTFTNP